MNALAHNLIKPPLPLAFALAALFALFAWRMKWLTLSGAISTFVVGLVIFGMGGGYFCIPLLTFFLSSSLLSKVKNARKQQAQDYAQKGAARDAGQVWANGGVAVLLVLLFAIKVHVWPLIWTRNVLTLYLTALATVNADTWATELGVMAQKRPRLLANWKPVPPGTSGAISLPGTLAAFAGAALIPLIVLPFWHLETTEFFIVLWAGFLGSFIDSLLGAGLQVQYRDLKTGELTERTERDGRPTQRARGLVWVNNDVVNFLASAGGVACAYFLLRYANLF